MSSAIDLRSDTVTLPSPAMRAAMAAAEVGDDVFGEDPTVRALEETAARLTGKDAALFVPSGSMANLIAQMVHVRRGDEVVVAQDSHVLLHEVGSGAAIAGVQYQMVPGDGLLTAGEVDERIKKPTFHTPGTGLVWIESTHNMAGGVPYSVARIREISDVCRCHQVPLHLDGARVFNAAVALAVDLAEIAAPVDSLSFCLSKGLGAPVGSVLCGSRAFRTEAHRLRKMLGGGMRQAGVLAAAGMFALRSNIARLAEDHAKARRIAETLAAHPGVAIDLERVTTNIVMVRLQDCASDDLVERGRRRGVLFLPRDRRRVRLVTHLDLSTADVDVAARILLEEIDRG